MNKSRIMFDMTVKEVREGLKEMKTVIVPIGITEQHGYHLPLSVDIHIAAEIAVGASKLSGCFVAPPLNYAFSGGTLPGTINLSPQAYSLVLMDICRSLVVQGFKNIILLLGHGGSENTRATIDAAENFQRLDPTMEGNTVSVIYFGELSPKYMKCFTEGDFHAGKYETSLMMHWKPEMVRMDEAKLDAPEIAHRLRTDPDSYASKCKVVDSKFVVAKLVQAPEIEVGVLGDYHGASAEFGREIAEEAVSNLAAFVKQLEDARG